MRERIERRNLSEDKKEKEENETAYLDLNSEKEVNVVVPRNFSKEKQDESKKIKSYGGRKIQEKEIRSGKEFFELTGHFDLTEGSLQNYLKEEGQGGGGDGGGGGHTFSHEEVTNVTGKEMRNVSSDLEENGEETILLSPPINYLKKEEETVKIVPPSIKNGGNRKDQEKEVTSTRIVNVSKDNTVSSWNSKENRKYDDTTSDSDRLNSSRMSIHEIDSQVRSFKDSQRNVRDPSGDFVSPRPVDYSTSYFPKDTKGGELRDDPSSDWNGHEMKEVVKEEEEEEKEEEEEEKGEGKRRYHEKKIKSKDSQRKFWLKDEEQMVENTTISLNDLPKLTPLTFPNIITDERKETIKRTNSEVSDYKGEVNRMKLPIIENKFTSSFPPTLKETEQEVSSNKKSTKSSRLLLSKKKRFKSTEKIESNTDPTINLSTNFNTSIRNQLLDSVTITEEENLETYSPRGNSMGGTTDISMTEKSKRTSRIPNSLTDRSFSSVEIEGFTYPFSDVVTSQSIDTFTTISIDENTMDKKFENTTSASSVWLSTVSLEKTTIGNVSVNKQSINDDHNSTNKPPWPVKHSAVVEGDLVLGGLMMVHEREDSVKCGPIMPQGGVQALEAMLYTLDTLNQREIVPGVKIGAHILDDCDKDTYGLEMAVDFIKGSISNIDGAEYHCNKTTVRKVISGVVGAASSVTSIQVANLLRLFRIPQVSFFSTSPELSNKQRFEYFSRTIPSDHYQVKAMVDIVLKMGWSYVSIIYEESNYGIKAFEELEELLTKNNICIAVKEKLVKDSGVAEETAYDTIVSKLLTKPRAKGCIIFGSDQEVAGVMRAVRRCNATGTFSWIGSDGWSARGLVSNGNEAEVEGTLSVQPQANPVMGFEEYFLNLTVENNKRNPWFVEFWEDHFQCRYPNSTLTPHNQKYTKACSTKERLTKENTVFEDQLQFVSDAVMAFAHAFRDMHRDLCGNKTGLCSAMKPTEGTKLLEYLRKVQFKGLSGDEFRFDENGDGPARYNIIHFKQTEPGVYKWIRVGKYLEGVLHLNMSMVQFKLGHNQTPESVCSLPCEVGQAKKYVEGESCCWHCFNCSQYQIRHPDDETQCKNCQQGTLPDETHSTCSEIPEEFLRLESGWAIGAMSFSAVGILVTLFVCGVFLKHNDTPVVRASGRELSYVLLIGILLCYLVTFALVLRPTDIVCSIQRFSAGFCFTVVYAALLTKTNRISRIFNAGKHSAKRPSFISPNSQLIICSGLVGVQILINVVWIVIDPAKAMHHYPTKEDNLLVCNSYIDASYMIAFAYPIILIVVCTIYAILTRKIPEAFNESKYIGFTMYTTCVIWLAFVPLYFGTGNHVALRITSMSVTISLSASLTIACLFTPKLYIILIRPDRNVRQNIMPPRPYNTTKSSAVTGTNASSMMATITLTAVTCDQNKAVKKHIIKTTDCSTQSEYYELELKERKNGKSAPNLISRGTQTQSNNNEKETNDSVHLVVDKESKETATTTRQINNTKIGNGPVNQNDVAL
ncbi:PREDICTED: metabotropic glutamate receptor 2-like isoform X1 [Polistes dominula]|uniref:Metabotropic glutamate receptor 2-like isoform X1 n=1 Tax=Polistes dominula TaxID=743375 RepID=A0ABM1IZW4_POLDO|nr:PREDICTED: metabotropic glutamate receptor 2-like isoform X1 [Polistes dominula]